MKFEISKIYVIRLQIYGGLENHGVCDKGSIPLRWVPSFSQTPKYQNAKKSFMKNRKISNERSKIIFPVLKILKYVQRNEDFNGSLIFSKILQWPNLKNLSGGLNLSRGLNMVGST